MFIDREEYTSHISDKEQLPVMRRLLDKIELVIKNYSCESTEFMTPWQVELSKSILNRFSEISYHVEGAYEEAERKVIVIYPDYLTQSDVDEVLNVFKITGNFKFNSIAHRDYMGAVMSLGINRDKIGDIIVHEEEGFLIVKKDVSNYVSLNLSSIGRNTVTLKKVEYEEVKVPNMDFKELTISISSLRLDLFLSSVYNISREISKKAVLSEKVKVNHRIIKDNSYTLKEGDLISLKGKGRVFYDKSLGTSKKGKLRVIAKIVL